jgi:hypothetical protein
VEAYLFAMRIETQVPTASRVVNRYFLPIFTQHQKSEIAPFIYALF